MQYYLSHSHVLLLLKIMNRKLSSMFCCIHLFTLIFVLLPRYLSLTAFLLIPYNQHGPPLNLVNYYYVNNLSNSWGLCGPPQNLVNYYYVNNLSNSWGLCGPPQNLVNYYYVNNLCNSWGLCGLPQNLVNYYYVNNLCNSWGLCKLLW